MRKTVAAIAFSLGAIFFGAAQAALLSPDPTGIWYDPDESGWGLSVAQQGDTIFAVLFVYGQNGAPAWYVASSVKYASDRFGVPGGPSAAGPLYRTSGPAFSLPFDPHAVSATAVGTLEMGYDDRDGSSLSLDYVIDGIRYTKILQRQVWRDTRNELAGHYQGQLVFPYSTCPDVLPSLPQDIPPSFRVTTGNAPGEVHIAWSAGIDTMCSIDGTYSQDGQFASVSGTLSCGPVGALVSKGSMQVFGISQNGWAMSGGARFRSANCGVDGGIAGVRILP